MYENIKPNEGFLKPNPPKKPKTNKESNMTVSFSDTYNPNIVRIFCNCHCLNGFQFHFDFEEDEDGAPLVYINALMDARHYKARSPWDCIKTRVKAAWLVLTGKERPLHDVILTKNDWANFYEQLTAFNNHMKENR